MSRSRESRQSSIFSGRQQRALCLTLVQRFAIGDALLFEFHKQLDKDGPHAHGQGELGQLGIAQGTSSGKSKRKQQHGQSCEYAKGKFRFRIHGCLTSLFRFDSCTPCACDEHHRRKTRKVQTHSLPRADRMAQDCVCGCNGYDGAEVGLGDEASVPTNRKLRRLRKPS